MEKSQVKVENSAKKMPKETLIKLENDTNDICMFVIAGLSRKVANIDLFRDAVLRNLRNVIDDTQLVSDEKLAQSMKSIEKAKISIKKAVDRLEKEIDSFAQIGK